jgi:hypothetical protein
LIRKTNEECTCAILIPELSRGEEREGETCQARRVGREELQLGREEEEGREGRERELGK